MFKKFLDIEDLTFANVERRFGLLDKALFILVVLAILKVGIFLAEILL